MEGEAKVPKVRDAHTEEKDKTRPSSMFGFTKHNFPAMGQTKPWDDWAWLYEGEPVAESSPADSHLERCMNSLRLVQAGRTEGHGPKRDRVHVEKHLLCEMGGRKHILETYFDDYLHRGGAPFPTLTYRHSFDPSTREVVKEVSDSQGVFDTHRYGTRSLVESLLPLAL